MSNWRTVRLGDVCDTISATYKKGSKSVVLINTSDVLAGKVLNHKKESNENLKGQFKKTFQRDDILYSEIRPQNRRFAFIDFEPTDYIASTKLMVLRCRQCILPKYLFHILSSDEIIQNLQALAETRSGTFPQITFSELSTIEIQLPSLAEQERIAGILGALDDKVECNNRINRNLEEQAAALFRRWFVDFEFSDSNGSPYRSSGGTFTDSPLGSIPQGWQVKLLGELCNVITKGTTPTTLKKSFVDSGINFVKAESISDSHCIDKNKIAFIDTETHELLKRSIIRSQDILFTIAGTIGRFCMIVEGDVPANTNQAVAIIRVNDEIISPFVIYSFFIDGWHKKFYDSRIQQAVQANLSLTSIRELPILLPDINSLNLYQGLIYPLFKSIEKNNKENQTIAILRDSLLPKLMNNEI